MPRRSLLAIPPAQSSARRRPTPLRVIAGLWLLCATTLVFATVGVLAYRLLWGAAHGAMANPLSVSDRRKQSGVGVARIQIASDLHLEFYGGPNQPPLPDFDDLITPSAPTLALLGDISVCGGDAGPDDGTPSTAGEHTDQPQENYKALLRWCLEEGRFAQVLVLAGNHEYYSRARRSAVDAGRALRALARSVAPPPAIVVLDGSRAIRTHVDGLLVAGATLWAHIPPEAMLDAAGAESPEYLYNDYRRIYVDAERGQRWGAGGAERESDDAAEGGGGDGAGAGDGGGGGGDAPAAKLVPLQGRHTNVWHAEDAAYIRREAAAAASAGENVLVLTHHAPVVEGTLAPAERPGVSAHPMMFHAAATDLSGLIAASPAIHTWAFGHTHFSCDLRVGGTRVVSNQRGYDFGGAEERRRYRRDFVLEVPLCMSVGVEPERRRQGQGGEGRRRCAVS